MKGLYPKMPTEEALGEYSMRMSKWRVTAGKLDAVSEHITEKCMFFPTVAEFALICEECGISTKAKVVQLEPWISFDSGGLRWVRRLPWFWHFHRFPRFP
jgi:hypothetical protein